MLLPLPLVPPLITALSLILLAVVFRPYLSRPREARASVSPPSDIGGRPLVLVPVCDEPVPIVAAQIRSLTAMLGMTPNCTAYLVDNSRGGRHSHTYLTLTCGTPIRYLRFANRGSKAAALNDALAAIGEDATHVAVFDADQQPVADFFSRFLPVLESSNQAAFVQAPQSFDGTRPTLLVRALSLLASLHYSIYLRGRNRSRTCPSLGTNVIYRSECLRHVGGFPEGVQTEDSVLSLRLHALGYSSLYVDRTAALGLLPRTLEAFFVQRSRWVRGAAELLKLTRRYIADASKWHMLYHYYLPIALYVEGLHFLLLGITPALLVAFPPSGWTTAVLVGFLFLPFLIGLLMLRRFFATSELLLAYSLMAVSAPVTLLGLLRGLLSPGRFNVTPRGWVGAGRWTAITLVTLVGILVVDGVALAWYGLAGLPAGTTLLVVGLLLHHAGICAMAVAFVGLHSGGQPETAPIG
jgi:hypothetical protein